MWKYRSSEKVLIINIPTQQVFIKRCLQSSFDKIPSITPNYPGLPIPWDGTLWRRGTCAPVSVWISFLALLEELKDIWTLKRNIPKGVYFIQFILNSIHFGWTNNVSLYNYVIMILVVILNIILNIQWKWNRS